MRIVIDMQGAQTDSRFRGIGRYTLFFAQAIARNRGEHEVFLALNGLFPETIEPIRAAFDGLLPQSNIRVWYALGQIDHEQLGSTARCEVAELIREAFLASLRPDIIHISSLFEGYVDDAISSIDRFDQTTIVSVALYDLIPLLNPDQYLKNPDFSKHYFRKIDYIKKAAICLAISESSLEEGVVHLGRSAEYFVNVSAGVENHFRVLSDQEKYTTPPSQKWGLNRPFILYTGGADHRKNLPRLIEAFAALPPLLRKGHQLLLVGRISPYETAALQALALKQGLNSDELLFSGHVTDDELILLYNLCQLFVFPSWHEGFGLPALEAMACGAPVIGSNISSIPEVIGLESALFNPLDVGSIIKKMVQALEDNNFRNILKTHGLQQAKRFSWDISAQRSIKAWESITQEKNTTFSLPKNINKPILAFVSPLPPERTGIADYSAELLPALSVYYEIIVIVEQSYVDKFLTYRIESAQWLIENSLSIDRVLYHFGNSDFHTYMLDIFVKVPGIVVLHDFFMGGFFYNTYNSKGLLLKKLYDSGGYLGVKELLLSANSQIEIEKYPCNKSILEHSLEIIAHSKKSIGLIKEWYGDTDIILNTIPLLRAAASRFDKKAARNQLGIKEGEFIICSFGFLSPVKLNRLIFDVWLNSKLYEDKKCRLIFVGENHVGEYGTNLVQAAYASGCGHRFKITGFVSPEIYRQYLMAADIAVQLRAQSRGETSAAVLDCMNYSLPLIVNANGSMAELDPEAVWVLPDALEPAVLTQALETLWGDAELRSVLGMRAREVILQRHSPADCAKRYAKVIENSARKARTTMPRLVQAIAERNISDISDGAINAIAKKLAATLPLQRVTNCIYLDISATCRNDLKTGIERVARALLLALLQNTPLGYRIEPIYLSEIGSEWVYRYARKYTLELLQCPTESFEDEVVEINCGDILICLDLSGGYLISSQKQGLFNFIKNHGASIYSVVFDLLPVLIPEKFPPEANQGHLEWLQSIANFDGAFCISKAVADDLATWRKLSGITDKDRRPYRIEWFHLGADVANSAPSQGVPENSAIILAQLQLRPSFLMVGTIEPRKGYLQTIREFDQLWADGIDVNLVIVGKEGWQGLPEAARRDIPQTIQTLSSHPELGKRLFWLNSISDEYLEQVYLASTCLIAASYGEGFGLPLIEASVHKLPIIARDLPVFHEVAGAYAFYFDGNTDAGLARTIVQWLSLYAAGQHPRSEAMPHLTWQESAAQLTKIALS